MGTVFGSTTEGVLIVLLLILVVVLIAVTVNLNLRMNRLQRRYRLFMKGTDGQSVEKAMANRLKEMAKLKTGQEQNDRALNLLRHRYDRMLCKYGIVKYDAFEDVGGKMSFALAMLDESNTGFVLNAIHSRDNCYLYLKDVVKGTSYIMLSDEEVEALRRAAHSGEGLAEAEEAAAKRRAEKKKKNAAEAPAQAQPEKPRKVRVKKTRKPVAETAEEPAVESARGIRYEQEEEETPAPAGREPEEYTEQQPEAPEAAEEAAAEEPEDIMPRPGEDIDPELAELLVKYAQNDKEGAAK